MKIITLVILLWSGLTFANQPTHHFDLQGEYTCTGHCIAYKFEIKKWGKNYTMMGRLWYNQLLLPFEAHLQETNDEGVYMAQGHLTFYYGHLACKYPLIHKLELDETKELVYIKSKLPVNFPDYAYNCPSVGFNYFTHLDPYKKIQSHSKAEQIDSD